MHCVGHGVLAVLDVRTQVLELVWRNNSTFLKHAHLLFLTIEYPYTLLDLTLLFVEGVFERTLSRRLDDLVWTPSCMDTFLGGLQPLPFMRG